MDALRDLEFFVLLCQKGSLSAAARELDVSAAATSKRLAGIEKRLGVQLLNRNTRTMSLTAAGEIYVEEARKIAHSVEALENRLNQQSGDIHGLLRLNASLGFGRKYMAAMVSEFIARYPKVEIQMHLSDHPLDLVASSYDIGIRFGELPDSTLHARKLVSHRRLICAAPAYIARHGTPTHPDQLAEHNCLILRQNEDTFSIWKFEHAGRDIAVRVSGNLSCNDGESIVAWALAGHGVIQRAEWEVSRHIACGELVELLADYVLPSADISAVYHYQQFVPPRVRAFIDFFDEYVKRAPVPLDP
ncbi:LysR family transcriptional regulator [Salinisphaera aquimarina]|uniref:LysR family transcriptional regulator n=1 Tax=Salinisphaera aquimarina TaxID=2094031 RepID=A0ABV7ELE2_9GAMM